MKKLIYTIIVIVGLYFGWDYFVSQKNTVEVSSTKLEETKLMGDSLADTNNRMREDLFKVLLLMNEVTINTMQLERISEGGSNTNVGSINKQLQEKMELLKKQLAEARENVKNNKELTAELNKMEQSFRKRESTIRRLKIENDTLDEKLKIAIKDLESGNEKLGNEKVALEQKNSELRMAINKRKQAEQNSWELAGDELVEAARIIPKANKFAGKQSREITHSKQMVLKTATECYNSAIRLANSYGNRMAAQRAHDKALEADRLFNLVTNYKSIGEDAYKAD